MTPRTLWTIILKIFGLYTVTRILVPLAQLFSSLVAVVSQQNLGVWQALGYLFFDISLFLFIIYIFLFKTDWLISTLKLDKGIKEDKIEINIHRSTVLTIVVLLTGIFLLADSLPLFLKELYSYYAVINDYIHFKNYPYASSILIEFIKTMVAIFMLSCSRLIVNFIERKRRKIELAFEEE